MNERQLKTKFKRKWPGFMINITERFSSGTPDSYCAMDGQNWWIEFKVNYNKPTDLQLHVMDKIKEQGIKCFVVRYNNKHDTYYIEDGRNVIYTCDTLTDVIKFIRGIKSVNRSGSID